MKQLTKLEAWRKIRDAYATPPEDRTEEQETLVEYGICAAIEELEWLEALDWPLAEDMAENTKSDKPDEEWGQGYFLAFGDSATQETNHLRADYCHLQAVIEETGGVR